MPNILDAYSTCVWHFESDLVFLRKFWLFADETISYRSRVVRKPFGSCLLEINARKDDTNWVNERDTECFRMVMTVFSALAHPTLDLDTRRVRLSRSSSGSSSTVNTSIENKHTHTSRRVPESRWLCGVIRVYRCVSVSVSVIVWPPVCVWCGGNTTTTTIRRCRQWCKRFQNHKQTVTILMQTLSVWKKESEARRSERERRRTHERKFVFVILCEATNYTYTIKRKENVVFFIRLNILVRIVHKFKVLNEREKSARFEKRIIFCYSVVVQSFSFVCSFGRSSFTFRKFENAANNCTNLIQNTWKDSDQIHKKKLKKNTHIKSKNEQFKRKNQNKIGMQTRRKEAHNHRCENISRIDKRNKRRVKAKCPTFFACNQTLNRNNSIDNAQRKRKNHDNYSSNLWWRALNVWRRTKKKK